MARYACKLCIACHAHTPGQARVCAGMHPCMHSPCHGTQHLCDAIPEASDKPDTIRTPDMQAVGCTL